MYYTRQYLTINKKKFATTTLVPTNHPKLKCICHAIPMDWPKKSFSRPLWRPQTA